MKITIYPTKTQVQNVLLEKRDKESTVLDSDKAELDKLAESKIIRPGQDVGLKHLIQQRIQYIAQIDAQLKLIGDDNEERICAEIEL